MSTTKSKATILTLQELKARLSKPPKAMKVENGRIVLPQWMRRDWKNAELRVREYSTERIVLERDSPEKRKEALAALRGAAGILKGKIPDPVAWQRKIRKERDRRLPKLGRHVQR